MNKNVLWIYALTTTIFSIIVGVAFDYNYKRIEIGADLIVLFVIIGFSITVLLHLLIRVLKKFLG